MHSRTGLPHCEKHKTDVQFGKDTHFTCRGLRIMLFPRLGTTIGGDRALALAAVPMLVLVMEETELVTS